MRGEEKRGDFREQWRSEKKRQEVMMTTFDKTQIPNKAPKSDIIEDLKAHF